MDRSPPASEFDVAPGLRGRVGLVDLVFALLVPAAARLVVAPILGRGPVRREKPPQAPPGTARQTSGGKKGTVEA